MVEYTSRIDNIFASLADPVRRDILERVHEGELSVNEIALGYDISLAAISKHLKVLREAGLIHRRKVGRFNMIRTDAAAFSEAEAYLRRYAVSQHTYGPPTDPSFQLNKGER